MKVLIIGNEGYVGSVCVPHLARVGGFCLYGFDAGYFEECLSGPSPEHYMVTQHVGDVREFDEHLLYQIDAVVYLAAMSNDALGSQFNELTHEVNYQACVDIATKAKAAGVHKFIVASSCSLYGDAGDEARKESDPLNPLTAYAKSKRDVEAGLMLLADENFHVTALRFATACGASPRLRLDLVLNDFVATALKTGKIDVLSDGTPYRPLIHVDDMARAIEWAILREESPYLVMNVGSNEWTYQVKDLAAKTCEILGDVAVSINTEASPDSRSYTVDFSLFQHLAPMYQPQVSLEDAVLGLRDQLSTMGAYDRDQFVRLKWFQLGVSNV